MFRVILSKHKNWILALVCASITLGVGFAWSISDDGNGRRFERTNVDAALLPPSWAQQPDDDHAKLFTFFGTDQLGRDVFSRCIVGGVISLALGITAAFVSVVLGTLWGTIAGLGNKRVDAAMMRIVDVLYGLPAVMLVVLITVAVHGLVEQGVVTSPILREMIHVLALLLAIGAVSWLTVSRVIRGQILSLRRRPSIDAAKTIGVGRVRLFTHHLLPSILGTIVVYATLTVPTAILSEAFLSFLGIGIREPLPSWGNLAADGLSQLNTVHSRWWLLLWPCLCIAATLVWINTVGQRLKRYIDPKQTRGMHA
ncbi:MAG: ABC transporter permease [Phycisphaerales bacterium]|jgi:ABC-type dipeptide/oligopeptide/nickel transport system permease subunit|nr:ABC transporter permease [Phycisphaerales bacterium]